jgi:cysteine synthase A
VGRVPIVKLHRVAAIFWSRQCYLKLESCNPGGSIKEKNAVWLVEEAERRGALQPGGTIVESSSGNFGLALAMMGALRGYRVMIVVDAKATAPARRMLLAHGAELVEITTELIEKYGTRHKARIATANELSQTIPGAWYPCQHHNPLNPSAHSDYTAQEIASAFPGGLDALVVGVSTGGQLSGLARHLLPLFPRLKIVAVDVEGSVVLADQPGNYQMTGLGLSFRPPNLDYQSIDCGYVMPERLAYSTCHAIAKKEGLLMGASTGAIVAAGIHVAHQLPAGSKICMMGPDRGDRYLETLYDAKWLALNQFRLTDLEELEEDILNTLSPVRGPW